MSTGSDPTAPGAPPGPGSVVTADVPEQRWALTLYVNGASPRSTEAIVAVRRLCDEDLAGQVDLRVINAAEHPSSVRQDHILALPTLVKHSPGPRKHLVGNLTDRARVRAALGLSVLQVHLDGSPQVAGGET